MSVSAVLITYNRQRNLAAIIDYLSSKPYIGEILIRDNGKLENLKCYGRYMTARQASQDIIYFQDDDCIVQNIDKIYEVFRRDPSRIAFGLSPTHYPLWTHRTFEYPQGQLAMMGWGSFVLKDWCEEATFQPYIDKYGRDAMFHREADRIFSMLLNRNHNAVLADLEHLPGYDTDGAMWKEQKVMPVEDSVMAVKTDIKKFMPNPEDLERVRQFESLKRQEHIENAKKYEHLKDNVNIDKVQDVALPQNKKQTTKIDIAALQNEKQKYIFYLFSKSIPNIAVESVFNQSKKLDINFYGVLRGIDKERVVLEKVKGIKGFEEITVKVNPLIFKAVGAQMVPAIVYAYCPPPAMFRTADCEWKYVVYGDISLLGALEVMGRHDSEAQRLYEELLNAF